MESGNESKGYVYCAHCDNVVSRSTFRRHERKRCSATSGSEIGQSQVTLYSSDSETSSSPVDEGEPVISSCTVRQVKDNNKHSIFNAFRMCPRRTRVCCPRRNVWRCNSRHRTGDEFTESSTRLITIQKFACEPCRRPESFRLLFTQLDKLRS